MHETNDGKKQSLVREGFNDVRMFFWNMCRD